MNRRVTTVLLAAVILALLIVPCFAFAAEDTRTIRVGWYETPLNRTDANGRRSGYAYEYQRKIAAYTGWKYQYVEGSWAELMEMLRDGRIDLLSDVSYTEERARDMLFTSVPMGSEVYYLYVRADGTDISYDHPDSLEGKKVGVTKNSVQKDIFLHWTEKNGVTVVLSEQECSEEASMKMLRNGELDAFVTLETYCDPDSAVPLWKIGSSEFYFAVSRDRPDLLEELETAMNRIQEDNPYYNEELSAKFLRNSGPGQYLSQEEKDWLEAHGPIRVGYQDHYMVFCARDPKTGELTGALKDCLEYAPGTLQNASPVFVAVSYPTAGEAMDALKAGEVDCVFPANLSAYDSEMAGIVLTSPLMRTEMDAVVRVDDRQDFLQMSQIRVGVNQGNTNYEHFLLEHYPAWTPVRYKDTYACLEQVAAKNVDCIIISNYRFSDIAGHCKRLNLTTVDTGVDMDYCFAVREGDPVLYSILSRMISRIPDSVVNAALTYYSLGNSETASAPTLQERWYVILPGIALAVLLVFSALLLKKIQKMKKSAEKGRGQIRNSEYPPGTED